MNEIQIFNNEEFGQIRTVTIDSEPWFVGKDVALALGYSDTKSAIQDHVDTEDKRIIQKGQIATLEIPNRGMTIINESGLYSLIFGSKLEGAKRFKHWVTSEVLPAIRKTGNYGAHSYRLKDATLPEVSGLLHEVTGFLREMDKVMRAQNSHPSDIAQEFKSICGQFGIVELSERFVKEPLAVEPVCFTPLPWVENEE
jgi:Prophage antirepressor